MTTSGGVVPVALSGVVVLTTASAERTRTWQEDWLRRQRQWRAALGYPDADVTGWLDRCVARRTADAVVLEARDGDTAVGVVAMSPRTDGGWELDDLWVPPEYRRRGHGAAIRAAAEAWCAGHGATTVTVTVADDPVQARLFTGYRLVAQHMARAVTERPVLADGLAGEPLAEAAFEAWLSRSIAGYVANITAIGTVPTEAAQQRAAADTRRLLPDGPRTADHSIWTLVAAGEPVATVWLMHGRGVARSFVYGVEVDARHRGRGFGKAAMRLGEQLAYDAGDRAVQLNVFGVNTTAIALYERLGYAVTERYHARDLGSGHD